MDRLSFTRTFYQFVYLFFLFSIQCVCVCNFTGFACFYKQHIIHKLFFHSVTHKLRSQIVAIVMLNIFVIARF